MLWDKYVMHLGTYDWTGPIEISTVNGAETFGSKAEENTFQLLLCFGLVVRVIYGASTQIRSRGVVTEGCHDTMGMCFFACGKFEKWTLWEIQHEKSTIDYYYYYLWRRPPMNYFGANILGFSPASEMAVFDLSQAWGSSKCDMWKLDPALERECVSINLFTNAKHLSTLQ